MGLKVLELFWCDLFSWNRLTKRKRKKERERLFSGFGVNSSRVFSYFIFCFFCFLAFYLKGNIFLSQVTKGNGLIKPYTKIFIIFIYKRKDTYSLGLRIISRLYVSDPKNFSFYRKSLVWKVSYITRTRRACNSHSTDKIKVAHLLI